MSIPPLRYLFDPKEIVPGPSLKQSKKLKGAASATPPSLAWLSGSWPCLYRRAPFAAGSVAFLFTVVTFLPRLALQSW